MGGEADAEYVASNMKELQYKDFSWRTHEKNWKIKQPNVCQFELTFRCDLRCKHCYSDCYNKPKYFEKELDTGEVKSILDKVHKAGVIWVCFTGGDPLTREDFLELYSYAKEKGFIVTIFTSCYSMTEEIARYLEQKPPFVIELTLNAVSKESYEKISQVKDSYEKVMDGLNRIIERRLPLKVKTQIIKDNFAELPKIKKFLEERNIKFRPSPIIQARLNGDTEPCSIRISVEEFLRMEGKDVSERDCFAMTNTEHPKPQGFGASRKPNTDLFNCAVGGGDGFHIDPYGNMLLCNLIRKPSVNLLENDIDYASRFLLEGVRGKKFTTDSPCRTCSIRHSCLSCPGRAYLETGDEEAPVEYFCELAKVMGKAVAGKKSSR